MLCAYGIRADGRRELLDFRLAIAESEAQWEAFLTNLAQRGLEGRSLRLVVTDGCLGSRRALEVVYPYVPRQRCWAHKLRNVAAKVPRKAQAECLKGAKRIYLAATRREAIRSYWAWAQQWRQAAPKAVACPPPLYCRSCWPSWTAPRSTRSRLRPFASLRACPERSEGAGS